MKATKLHKAMVLECRPETKGSKDCQHHFRVEDARKARCCGENSPRGHAGI